MMSYMYLLYAQIGPVNFSECSLAIYRHCSYDYCKHNEELDTVGCLRECEMFWLSQTKDKVFFRYFTIGRHLQ